MKKRCEKALCAFLAAVMLLCGAANANAAPAPVQDACRAYVLVEADTGQTLADHCADDVMPMASLTKMMTLLILFEAIDAGTLKLTDQINVSQNAADTGGSKAFLDAGAQYELDRLIRSIIVGSANDSCVAVAETLAGSEEAFAMRMNERAQALGMTSTHFANATGLPAQEHYSTARDLAKLSAALVRHKMYFDHSCVWIDNFAHPSGRETMLANTNKLIRYGNAVDGIKTGFTNDAGFCLSASSERNGMRLIAVVLGGQTSKGRFDEAMELLEWGFANYEILRVARPPQEFELRVPVRGAKVQSVSVLPQTQFVMLVQKGADQSLTHEVLLPPSVDAPIAQGQELGEWVVSIGDANAARIPLLAGETVQRATFADCLRKILCGWLGMQRKSESPPWEQRLQEDVNDSDVQEHLQEQSYSKQIYRAA